MSAPPDLHQLHVCSNRSSGAGLGHVTCCVSAQVSSAQVNLQTLLPAARRQLQRLHAIKQEVNELWRHRQVQVQQQASCRRYQDRLQKVQKHHLD